MTPMMQWYFNETTLKQRQELWDEGSTVEICFNCCGLGLNLQWIVGSNEIWMKFQWYQWNNIL